MKPTLPIVATFAALAALPAIAQTTAPPPPPEPATTDGTITGARENGGPLQNFTDFLQGGSNQPLVSRRQLDDLEREKFGGSTIDPAGRNDDFYSPPVPAPNSRLKRY